VQRELALVLLGLVHPAPDKVTNAILAHGASIAPQGASPGQVTYARVRDSR